MDLDVLAIQIRQHMDVAKAHIENAEVRFVEFGKFMESAQPLLARLEAVLPALEEMATAHEDARGSAHAPPAHEEEPLAGEESALGPGVEHLDETA